MGLGRGVAGVGGGVSLTLAETRVRKNKQTKNSFSKTGNQQTYWAKVKVVTDVIFYTLFIALSRTRSSNCTVTYAWIWQPHESKAINIRVCDDYLTVASFTRFCFPSEQPRTKPYCSYERQR